MGHSPLVDRGQDAAPARRPGPGPDDPRERLLLQKQAKMLSSPRGLQPSSFLLSSTHLCIRTSETTDGLHPLASFLGKAQGLPAGTTSPPPSEWLGVLNVCVSLLQLPGGPLGCARSAGPCFRLSISGSSAQRAANVSDILPRLGLSSSQHAWTRMDPQPEEAAALASGPLPTICVLLAGVGDEPAVVPVIWHPIIVII